MEMAVPSAPPPPDDTIDRLNALYREIVHDVSLALHLDEAIGSAEATVDQYELAYIKILSAIASWPPNVLPDVKQNLINLREQVEQRKSSMKINKPTTEAPPLYPDLTPHRHSDDFADNTLLYIPTNIQLYYIDDDGTVSLPCYPTFLRLLMVNDGLVLNVGEKLILGISPSLRVLVASRNKIIFPHPEKHGVSVAIQAQSSVAELVTIMSNVCKVRYHGTFDQASNDIVPSAPEVETMQQSVEASAPPLEDQDEEMAEQPSRKKSKTDSVSDGILKVSAAIGRGLVYGGEKGSQLLARGGGALRGRMAPSGNDRVVSRDVKKSASIAHAGTHVVATTTGKIVDGVGSATASAANFIAPIIYDKAKKYLPESWTKASDGERSTLEKAGVIASASMEGVGTIWQGLEVSAKCLGVSIANETARTVEHKYGPETGRAAHDGLFATGNVLMAVTDYRRLGLKALAKRSCYDTGVGLAKTLAKKNKGQ